MGHLAYLHSTRRRPGRHLHSGEQEPARRRGAPARREEVCVSMENAHARPPRFPVDQLTAIREWIWRHSSQPNGDPWDGDPEHLDWAAQNLLNDLAQWLVSTDPQPASSTPPPADTARIPGRSLHLPQ